MLLYSYLPLKKKHNFSGMLFFTLIMLMNTTVNTAIFHILPFF